jgi:hypothetical protein
MKTIFKEGDRVYIIPLGWGNIINVNEWDIEILFDNNDDTRYVSGDVKKLLSFTEYTLEGFSQERSEPLPKKGQIVWGRDHEFQSWHIYHFSHKTEDGIYHLSSDNKRNMYQLKEITTENPYANEQ